MTIEFSCSQCGRKFSVRDELAGRRAKCKSCGKVVVVPAAELDEPETSPGGGPIYRHAERSKPFETAVGDEETLEAITSHLARHVGEPGFVFHELISDLVHIDVHVIEPTSELPFRVLVTSGMSDRPMTVPAGAEEFRYGELMLFLPPRWPVSQEAFQDEKSYWPVRWLKMLARFPHEYDTWLSIGHTIPNGDPPEPFVDDTNLCAWVLVPPILLSEEAQSLYVSPAKTIYFYQLFPLYQEELDFKLQHGFEAIADRVAELSPTEWMNPRRKNVCSRAISVKCSCGKTLEAGPNLAGQRFTCPDCGSELLVPDRRLQENQRTVTLSDEARASAPGGIRVQKLHYIRHFPLWPVIWAGGLLMSVVLALLHSGFWVAVALLAVMNWLYWRRVKEHFLHGCVNPAIVVSLDPPTIAVLTDLTTGWEPYPVIKILPQPLSTIDGQPPAVGTRLSTVALYSPGESKAHWADFDPKAVECVTADRASIQHTLSQIDEDDWQELSDRLKRVPRPLKPGLYHVPDEYGT